jgi:sugar lactone lactonase YvrE
MVSFSTVQPLTNLKAVAGESPLWSESEQALYWVDIKDPRVLRHSFVDASLKSWPKLPATSRHYWSLSVNRCGVRTPNGTLSC